MRFSLYKGALGKCAGSVHLRFALLARLWELGSARKEVLRKCTGPVHLDLTILASYLTYFGATDDSFSSRCARSKRKGV